MVEYTRITKYPLSHHFIHGYEDGDSFSSKKRSRMELDELIYELTHFQIDASVVEKTPKAMYGENEARCGETFPAQGF